MKKKDKIKKELIQLMKKNKNQFTIDTNHLNYLMYNDYYYPTYAGIIVSELLKEYGYQLLTVSELRKENNLKLNEELENINGNKKIWYNPNKLNMFFEFSTIEFNFK